jgi:hypothetical protein
MPTSQDSIRGDYNTVEKPGLKKPSVPSIPPRPNFALLSFFPEP